MLSVRSYVPLLTAAAPHISSFSLPMLSFVASFLSINELILDFRAVNKKWKAASEAPSAWENGVLYFDVTNFLSPSSVLLTTSQSAKLLPDDDQPYVPFHNRCWSFKQHHFQVHFDTFHHPERSLCWHNVRKLKLSHLFQNDFSIAKSGSMYGYGWSVEDFHMLHQCIDELIHPAIMWNGTDTRNYFCSFNQLDFTGVPLFEYGQHGEEHCCYFDLTRDHVHACRCEGMFGLVSHLELYGKRSITSLNLTRCQLTIPQLHDILTGICAHNHFKSLNISHNPLIGENVDAFQYCVYSSLTELNVEYTRFNRASLQHLLPSHLPSSFPPGYHRTSSCPPVTHLPSLLALFHCCHTLLTYEDVIDFLPRLPHLTSLSCNDGEILYPVHNSLLTSLSNHSTTTTPLTSLSLPIADLHCLLSFPSLTYLNLDRVAGVCFQSPTSASLCFPHLCTLILPVIHDDVEEWKRFIDVITTLHSVTLGGTCIRHLLPIICNRNAKSLRLVQFLSKIGDDIMSILPASSKLTSIHLHAGSYNNIGPHSLRILSSLPLYELHLGRSSALLPLRIKNFLTTPAIYDRLSKFSYVFSPSPHVIQWGYAYDCNLGSQSRHKCLTNLRRAALGL